MPHIAVSSNVKASDVDSARAIREISKTLSAVLEHAEDSFMVQISLDQNIIFGGADVPFAFVEIHSIIKVDPESNVKTVEALTKTVTEHVGVPGERVFVNLHSMPPANFSWKSSTIAKLYGL